LDIRQCWDSNDEFSLKAEFSLVPDTASSRLAAVCMEAKNCFAACDRLNWPRGCSQKRIKMDHFLKIRITLGLCVVLGASFNSVRAADNPAQAAARAALEQKLSQSDAWEPQSLTTATNTPSKAVVEQPGKAATKETGTVSEKAVTPQTAPVATTPVVAPTAVVPAAVVPAAEAPAAEAPAAEAPAAEAPAAVAPAAVAPAAVAPVAVAPVAVAPTMSFPMLSFLLLSLLLLSLLILSLLLLKLRQVKLLLLKHPTVTARAVAAPPVAARAVVAPSEIQPAAAAATSKPTPAPATTKRPVQRRKRVPKLNGAESDVNLPKIDWATTKAERKRPTGAG
jgi:hypothetical protein